ncbi:hypothetical protein J3F83DRAFT_723159 [Trichoderma novae-zelandiae]
MTWTGLSRILLFFPMPQCLHSSLDGCQRSSLPSRASIPEYPVLSFCVCQALHRVGRLQPSSNSSLSRKQAGHGKGRCTSTPCSGPAKHVHAQQTVRAQNNPHCSSAELMRSSYTAATLEKKDDALLMPLSPRDCSARSSESHKALAPQPPQGPLGTA